MKLDTRTPSIPDRGPIILIVSILLVTLSTILVLVRFYHRLFMFGNRFGTDDSLIGIAWVSSFAFPTHGWSFNSLLIDMDSTPQKGNNSVRFTDFVGQLLSVGHSIGDVIGVVEFGYGKHKVDLPLDIRDSHRADLVSHSPNRLAECDDLTF